MLYVDGEEFWRLTADSSIDGIEESGSPSDSGGLCLILILFLTLNCKVREYINKISKILLKQRNKDKERDLETVKIKTNESRSDTKLSNYIFTTRKC